MSIISIKLVRPGSGPRGLQGSRALRAWGSHSSGIQVQGASQGRTCTCSLRELLTLKKKKGRKEQFGERERARQQTAVFPPHVSSSASRSPRHPVTSPNGRNVAGPLAPAPGKRTPLSLHTHARARARGHRHRCVHTQTPPLPSAGLPSGLQG